MPGPEREQLPLFGPGFEGAPRPSRSKLAVEPASASDELHALARRLPPRVHLGTSSWSFPGWEGLVYAQAYPTASLAREGLRAYAQQPLLRAVGLDRSYYGPVDADALADYAAVVPEGFRFLAKAHEVLTLARFPRHRRYGERSGKDNPQWLDAAYATDHVVRPFVEGLAAKGGVLLFQLAPQDEAALGGRRGFPELIHRFLTALPPGPCYAVELRNHKLLTPAYADALRDAGALHCVSVHPRMPDVRTQARQVGALDRPGLVVRWMLTPRMNYELARKYYHPFDTLVDPDPIAREGIAELVRAMSERGRPSMVIVNNKAEGCAPRSIEALARAIVGEG